MLAFSVFASTAIPGCSGPTPDSIPSHERDSGTPGSGDNPGPGGDEACETAPGTFCHFDGDDDGQCDVTGDFRVTATWQDQELCLNDLMSARYVVEDSWGHSKTYIDASSWDGGSQVTTLEIRLDIDYPALGGAPPQMGEPYAVGREECLLVSCAETTDDIWMRDLEVNWVTVDGTSRTTHAAEAGTLEFDLIEGDGGALAFQGTFRLVDEVTGGTSELTIVGEFEQSEIP